MAATNTTPATATNIAQTALPYSLVVSAADWASAPTGTGYASTCDSTQYAALWWAYTTGPNETFLSLQADALALTSGQARVSIWRGPLAALTQYVVGAQNYCDETIGGYFQVVVVPNTRYYFQVTHTTIVSPDAALTFQLRAAPQLAAPGGSVVIPNDTEDFPAVVMAGATGVPVRVVDLPANEYADTLPGCLVAIGDFNVNNANVTLYQGDLTTIVGSYTASADIVALKSNRLDRIYFIGGLGAPKTVGTLNSSAVFTGVTWTLPADSALARCFAVTQDNTILYYGSETASAVIHAWDLVNSVALPDLIGAQGVEWLHGHGDGIALVDGSVIFGYASDVVGHTGKLRRISAAGAVLRTYTLGATFVKFNHFCYVDEYSFLAWGYAAGSDSVFRLIKISDGTTIHEWLIDTTGPGGPSTSAPVPISLTCPVFVLPYSDNGSLTVPGSGGCGLLPPIAPLPPQPPLPDPDDFVHTPIRFVREGPTLADEDDHHNIIFDRIELVCTTGLGAQTVQVQWATGQGPWQPLRHFQTSELGETEARAYLWNLGMDRSRRFRIIHSDPVPFAILDALMKFRILGS